MRRDLGAAVPREPRAPVVGIVGMVMIYVGGLTTATGAMFVLLAMLGGVK